MKKQLAFFTILFSIFFTSVVFGKDIRGTAWLIFEEDNDKKVIFFEKDGTFTYLNIINASGNEGEVYSDSEDTWKKNGNLVIISFSGGYKLVSLTMNNTKDRMSGTAVNKVGKVEKILATQIK
tara:strand:+ start:65 stop:433 length:369 start_codon:yes stop_codon:yes gene_type:complete